MWQPIETAPKDGTKILVYGGGQSWPSLINPDTKERGEADDWLVVFWDYNMDSEKAWMFCNYEGAYGEWYKPTHWQPLPEPPA
jgi:hypothetical protein